MKVITQAIIKEDKPKTKDVLVTLLETDYNHIWLSAKAHNETIAEWISSLVNTALQP